MARAPTIPDSQPITVPALEAAATRDRRPAQREMALSRSRLVQGALAQLRCSTALLDAPAAAAAAPMAGAPHMPLAPPQPAALGASQALAAAWQPARGISAATVLMAERQAGGSAQPQPPPAAGGSGTAAGSPNDDEELSDDEEADAMAEAFERLIQAAFEMVQQGKPMEAEYVLAEGAPLLSATLVRLHGRAMVCTAARHNACMRRSRS